MKIFTADGDVFDSFGEWLTHSNVQEDIESIRGVLSCTRAAAIQILLLTQITANTSLAGDIDQEDEDNEVD